MAILICNAIRGSDEDWQRLMSEQLPDEDVRLTSDIGDPADIEVLVFGRPKFDELPSLPNLKVMMTMLAGVDGLANNPLLPDATLTKIEPMDGDPMMTEYCLLHVLRHHRQLPAYAEHQRNHEWKAIPQPKIEERRVGFLGYGTLAQPMAEPIRALGFDVAAWARTPKPEAEIEVFHGPDGFKPFLNRTEIAIIMLPLTDETRELMNAEAFAAMPQGAAVINLARGGVINHGDMIDALDNGQLAGATLDVTEPEPLPADSPLWDHPNLTILPHVARRPPVEQYVPQAAENVRRFRAGEPLLQIVDWSRGY